MRGSGDLYAWVDSLLYLRMHKGQLEVAVEHRSAPSRDPVPIELIKTSPHLHLAVVGRASNDDPVSYDRSILSFLTSDSQAKTTEEIRKALGLRKERVVGLLRQMEAAGRIRREGRSWCRTGGDGASRTDGSAVQTVASTASPEFPSQP